MLQNINEEMLNKSEIGKRIFGLRTEKKLSQAKLAEQVSMTGNSISNIENGKQMCKLDKVQRFARALDTSVNFLLYGSSSDNQKEMNQMNEEALLLNEMLAEWNKLSLLDKKRLLAGMKAANSIVA